MRLSAMGGTIKSISITLERDNPANQTSSHPTLAQMNGKRCVLDVQGVEEAHAPCTLHYLLNRDVTSLGLQNLDGNLLARI